MAEQNILNGDQQVLEQILGDINEHAEKKERLERMSVSIRDITKEIDSTTKVMEDEISSRISESTDSICAGYDKAVSQDKDTIKQVQADRDKAKMQGIKERIASETASLRAENKSLQNEINEAFIQEIYPVGVLIYGEVMENGELTSIKLKAQEQREIVLHFIMSQGVLRDDRRWMLKKSQIRIVLSNYPVHEIIVLDDIKGL